MKISSKQLELISNYKSLVNVKIDEYKANPNEEGIRWICDAVADYNLFYAIENIASTNKQEVAKQYLYTSGRLTQYSVVKFNSNAIEWDKKKILIPLLSDSEYLIQILGNLRNKEFEKGLKNGESTIIYVIQAIIREDWDDFEYLMKIVKEKSLKKYKNIEADYLFFESIYKNDKSGCEQAINMLLEEKINNHRNRYSFCKDFFSFPALGYAKLAWLKDIEVDINHPGVPKELLLVRPNKEYIDEYDFLKNL